MTRSESRTCPKCAKRLDRRFRLDGNVTSGGAPAGGFALAILSVLTPNVPSSVAVSFFH